MLGSRKQQLLVAFPLERVADREPIGVVGPAQAGETRAFRRSGVRRGAQRDDVLAQRLGGGAPEAAELAPGRGKLAGCEALLRTLVAAELRQARRKLRFGRARRERRLDRLQRQRERLAQRGDTPAPWPTAISSPLPS
jgi:hypothetical protein